MSRKLLIALVAFGVAALLLPATASAQFACFPTCSTTDARMLAFASADLATFDSNNLSFVIGAPATSPMLLVGVMDGDNNGNLWDRGSATVSYTLYADPAGDGTGTVILATYTDADFTDGIWVDKTMPHSPLAQAPSGNYFYRFDVEAIVSGSGAATTFKVRTSDTNTLRIDPQAFSFLGMAVGSNDLSVIYPSFPSLTPTTYDGTWTFFTDIEFSATVLQFWDGDMDFGQADCNPFFQDTDDPDTPGSNPLNNPPIFIPPWAAPATTNEEGVAIGRVHGCGQTTGAPSDDAVDFPLFQRAPSVFYQVTTPTGITVTNDNPSGNKEWETFTLTVGGGGDVSLPSLPPGNYTIRMVGMDLANFNAWFLPSSSYGICEDGTDCSPRLRPYLVGDTVFFDADGDGIQDPGEPGIEDVLVLLRGPFGAVKATATTGTDGKYSFEVAAGTYTVEVDPSNFAPGGALEGLSSTTGDTMTDTVVDANILTYDFGYTGNSSIGDFVWYDANGNGLQDDGPDSGIGGVTVNLREAGPDDMFDTPDDVIFPPMVTADDGSYDFEMLIPGTYRVDVDESTLPANLALTTANEPLVVNLALNQDFNDADFGYDGGTGSLGDRVWLDRNSDGVQDSGEPGIVGVTVRLFADLDGDGMDEFSRTAVTGANGIYNFDNLPEGSYRVEVDTATLPQPVVQTFDLDGLGTPDEATASLTDGQTRDDVDFGYVGPGSIGDRVWIDSNGDGVQDPGEPGQNGVTVELRDGSGNLIDSQVTSGDGNYLFGGLLLGDYTVTVVSSTLPAGLDPTFDLDGIGTPHTANVALTPGRANRDDVDFGYRGNASVGDRVWKDLDGDGVQDAGEAGINLVTVNLLDAGGNVIDTDVTSGDGNYLFENLLGGNYTVQVDASTLPAGLAQTFDLDGLATPNAASFALAGGEAKRDVDFGYDTGSIGDRVWQDNDSDGVQDAGEPGINGVTVILRDSGGNIVDTQVTSGDGNYTFNDVPAGDYTVEVDPSTVPAGFTPTFDLDGVGTPNSASFSLGAGENKTDVDFGYVGLGSIGDRVWLDLNGDGVQDPGEPGINGVTVNLVDPVSGTVLASQMTAGDGIYIFGGLMAGTYRVEVDPSTLPAGATQTFDLDGLGTPNAATVPLAGNQDRMDVDFGYQVPPSSVCLPTFGFEIDGDGNPLQKGQIIDSEFAALGVTVTTNDPSNHPAMIFDSANPTGGDYDLGTPNQAFGGPGVGSGGGPGPGANANALGKVLIISEDGDSSDPDDNYAGGTIIFTFATPVEIASVDILDIDANENMGEVRAYGAGGNLIAVGNMQNLGNNSFQTVQVGASGVARLEIEFPKSGAVAGITFCVEEEICLDKADGDPAYTSSAGGHAIWLPGMGSDDFVFSPVGTFTQNADGTATITGTVIGATDPSIGFNVSVQLTGFTNVAPPGSPKKELDSNAYSENGGPVNTSTWQYYTGVSGTLTGVGGYAGATVSISATGPAFQVGVGANGKNINPGASSWFNWSVTSQPSSGGSLPYSGQGDFNLDFVPCDGGGGTSCTPGRARDDFNNSSFSGSTGPSSWSGDWIEDDPQSGGAGPGSGQVKVTNGYLRLDDAPDTGGYPSLARQVDLSNADFATLRFDFDTSSGVDSNDAVTVEASSNGGATWTTLEVITGISGETWQDREFDISAFISSETRVRFRVSNLYGGDNEYFYVNFVEIEWGCDTTPPPSSQKDILFVVGDIWLNSGDDAIKTRLEGRGFNVMVMAAVETVASDTNGKDLVLISSTVNSSDLGNKLTNVAVPIITWENYLYDDLGMTGSTAGTHYGSHGSQTKVDVVNGSPLGVSNGTKSFTTSGQTYSWGKPNSSAKVFATFNNDPAWKAIFGYEAGASMPGLTAPARRVGISLYNETPGHLTGGGWDLFDAVVDWACDDGPSA